MDSASYTPEDIVVIGGGLSGCLAALFAARAKDARGRPQYKVTLLEAKPDLLMGASSMAARLHLGGEYPNDPQTGKDCLTGAALWKIVMPQHGILTDQEPMRFLIARTTEMKGRRGDKGGAVRLHNSGGYLQYYTKDIQPHYKEVIEMVHDIIVREGSKCQIAGENASGWSRERIAKSLFGLEEKFSEVIVDAEDRHWYGDEYIVGGFKSQEPGLNLPHYLEAVKNAVREAGVHVITNCPVERIEISSGSNGYTVHCKGSAQPLHARQIIQAAWEGGFALDGEHRIKPKEVNVYRRAMVLVDTSRVHPKPPPSFVLKDDAGGMYSPLHGGNEALVYHPLIGHLGACRLNSADPGKRRVPDDWQKPLSPKEEAALLARYKAALVKGPFPFLRNAVFKKVIVQPTLNFQEHVDQRRHEPTEEIKPGYHVMYSTKLTLALQSAIEAVEKMRTRSDYPYHHILPPAPDYALNVALKDETYRLGNVLKLPPDMNAVSGHDPTTQSMSVDMRTFGQGFGNYKVNVYTEDGPKTGPVFDENPTENARICSEIRRWAESPEDTRPLTETGAIALDKLTRGVANRLLHADTLEMLEWLKDPDFLTKETLELLFSRENMRHFPADSWKAIRESRPHIRPLGSFHKSVHNPAMRGDTKEAMTALLPGLFASLAEPARIKVARQIILALHERGKDKEFFAPLADPDFNRLVISRPPQPVAAKTLGSNGRSIQISHQASSDPRPTDFSIQFQGKKFYPVQFHFHRTRNLVLGSDGAMLTEANVRNTRGKKDGEFEFRLYRNAAEKAQAEASPATDKNNEAVGELHAIFMTPKDPKTGYKSALALCAHVKLGEKNTALDRYIEPLRARNHPLMEGESLALSGQPFSPLECFNHGAFDAQKIPQAPFASLHLGGFDISAEGRVVLKKGKSDVFYRGVEVVHLPEEQSVTLSPEQLETLQKAQPMLAYMPLDSKITVKPISRAISSARGLQR